MTKVVMPCIRAIFHGLRHIALSQRHIKWTKVVMHSIIDMSNESKHITYCQGHIKWTKKLYCLISGTCPVDQDI